MRCLPLPSTSFSEMNIERMSTPAIERMLESRLDLPALKQEFRRKACSDTPPVCVYMGIGGAGTSVTRPAAASACRFGVWDAARPWLIVTTIDGTTSDDRRRSLHEKLEWLCTAAVETSRSQAGFDGVWPYADAIQRLGVAVRGDRDLSEQYAQFHLKILSDLSPGAARYALTWTIRGLFDDSAASARIALRIASLIAEGDAPVEARITLKVMSDVWADLRKHLPPVQNLPPLAMAAWSSFARHAGQTARETCRVLVRRGRSLDVVEVGVPKLVRLMTELDDNAPLYGLLAMASARRALHAVGTALRNVARTSGGRLLVRDVCERMFETVGKGGRSYFLALEALEGLREQLPHECATALATVHPAEKIWKTSIPMAVWPKSKKLPAPVDPVFLDDRFWSTALPGLLAFAAARLHRTRWRGSFGWPAGAMTPDDYVQEAVTVIFSRNDHDHAGSGSHFQLVAAEIDALIRRDAARPENRAMHELLERSEEAIVEALSPPATDDLLAARELFERFRERVPERCRAYVDIAAEDAFATLSDRAAAMQLPESDVRSLARTVRQRRACWEGAPPPQRR